MQGVLRRRKAGSQGEQAGELESSFQLSRRSCLQGEEFSVGGTDEEMSRLIGSG